jgi:GTPase SAR1 family protein
MYLILFVGGAGQGKTSMVKKLIQDKNQYVFDINNEYQHLPKDIPISSQMRNVDADIPRFVKNCSIIKNTNIVFEDATGFLQGRQSKGMSRLMAAKRHSNNNYMILFHSINRVPPEIMEMANYLFLYKTNDNPEQVQRKFGNELLTRNVLQLIRLPKHSYIKMQLI